MMAVVVAGHQVTNLVDERSLLLLHLEQLLDCVLDNLPSLLHAAGECSQRLFQF